MSNKSKTEFRPFALKSVMLAALVAGGSVSAFAGAAEERKETLLSWANEASVAVDNVMEVPRAVGRDVMRSGTVAFRVTVDDDGDVIASQMTERVRSASIRHAARNVVRNVDLPDLPTGYDELTFELRLSYLIDPADIISVAPRGGRVETRRIADKNAKQGPLSAGLRIISATADGR